VNVVKKTVSIGCFVGNDAGLDFVNDVGKDYPIHLGFFQFSDWKKYNNKIKPATKISSGHLVGPVSPSEGIVHVMGIIDWFRERILPDKYEKYKLVAHPNFGLYKIIQEIIESKAYDDVLFCLENFPFRARKVVRTPVEIILHNLDYSYLATNEFGFCLDTAHLDKEWYHISILDTIMNYVNIIHLSNQNGGQHLPILEGDLNLHLILDRVKKKKLNIEICLEYMAEYKSKAIQDAEYVRKYLGW